MRKRQSSYILPWEEKKPVSKARVLAWTFIVVVVLGWVILSVEIDVPQAEAQSFNVEHRVISLMEEEVEHLKEISCSLAEIKSELEQIKK